MKELKCMIICLLTFLTMIFSYTPPLNARPVNIIPEPKLLTKQNGFFKIDDKTKIIVDGRFIKELNTVLRDLSTEIKTNTGIMPTIETLSLGVNTAGSIIVGDFTTSGLDGVKVTDEAARNKEGYVIKATEKQVNIAANDVKGMFYGIITLQQLINRENDKCCIPSVIIQDWPSFPIRGISDDISRGQVSTVDNFKKIIRFLARYKMNFYQLYIEDMYRFRAYPSIGRNRDALTSEEIKELEDYGSRYFIEIMPIFQTLGHYENILAMNEFIPLAEFPGAGALNTNDEKVYEFLENVLKEIAPAFKSSYFNMGADETYDVGLGASKKNVEQTGIENVLATHYNRVYKILKNLNKNVMIYGDIILTHPATLDKIPKDLTIIYWDYIPQENYPSIKTLKNSQIPFFVSPGLWNWARVYPDYNTASKNIATLNREGLSGGAQGSITSSWGDCGAENLRELNWYGYALGAATAWDPQKTNLSSFLPAFLLNYFGTSDDKMASVFENLASVGPLCVYSELWRCPFVPFDADAKPEKIKECIKFLRTKAESARKLLPDITKNVTKNKDYFDYISFITKQILWYADKLDISIEIQRMSSKPSITEDDRKKIISWCSDMIKRLNEMKKEYTSLWLLTNRQENLNLIMKRYDMQISYWEEKKDEAQRGLLKKDYLIQSKWIFCNNSGSKGSSQSSRESDTGSAIPHESKPAKEKPVSHASFRKEFKLNSIPKKAYLQVIADNKAEITLNGKKVCGVFARYSLSLGVEFMRVKTFDLRPYLKAGSNVLEADVENFDNRDASLNLYIDMVYDYTIAKLFTDETWSAKNLSGAADLNAAEEWKPVKVRPCTHIITEPNLLKERHSWIERW